MNVNGASPQHVRASSRLGNNGTLSSDKRGSDSAADGADHPSGTTTSLIASAPTTTAAIAAQPTTSEYLTGQSSPANVMTDESMASGSLDKARSGGIQFPAGGFLGHISGSAIKSLQDQVNSLEVRLNFATGPERFKVLALLSSARAELRQESLRIIENELQVLNNTSRPDKDSPYSSFADTSLTRADLESFAAGPKDAPLTIAAQNLLNDADSFSEIAGADGAISLGDIQSARITAEKDFENAAEQEHGANGVYEVPDGTDATIGSAAHQPEIGQAAFDTQQDAIEQAIRTGEEVSFVNGAGETVRVTVTPQVNGGSASYTVQVREFSDAGFGRIRVETSSFTLNSEIGTEETITALANIVDWGSSLETVGANVPDFPGIINLRQERDPSAAASYSGPTDTMNFFNGTANINKSTYIHEMGHAIGYALAESGATFQYSPAGWEDVLAGANGSVSEYVLNPQEEFSEALAAYVNAADHGPEALAEFRAAFPDRAAFIETNILSVDSGPTVKFPVVPSSFGRSDA